jgi:hypothetical protein
MAATPFYNQIHTTKKFRLLAEKSDPAGNKYVYLKGVASLAAGDFVQYGSDGATVRALSTTPTTGAIAMAMSANTSSSNYSWFMIHGSSAIANVATQSTGAGKALFLSSTAGRLTITPATELSVVGAFSAGNSVSNVGSVFMIGRPCAVGDIST